VFKSRQRIKNAFEDLQEAHREIILQREEIQQQKEELVQTLHIVEAQQYEIESRRTILLLP